MCSILIHALLRAKVVDPHLGSLSQLLDPLTPDIILVGLRVLSVVALSVRLFILMQKLFFPHECLELSQQFYERRRR